MALQKPFFVLLLIFLIAIVFVSADDDDSSIPSTHKRFDIPDAVHTLLDNISDDLTDVLQRLGKLLTGQSSLPVVLVEVVKDVIKILGSVIAALGQILGLRGK